MKIAHRLLCFSLLSLLAAAARAGTFDCSVVYDEFDSLMNRNYLVEPDRYVGVKPESLSNAEFETLQKGQFHLYPQRADLGVALVHTNRNLRAKLLIDWSASDPARDEPVIGIPLAVIIGRVEDGYAPRRLAPLKLPAGYTLDLDRDMLQPAPDEDARPGPGQRGADLVLEDVDGELRLSAINGASVLFPVESLCSSASR